MEEPKITVFDAVQQVKEFLAEPLPDNQIRILHCTVCGAINYIRYGHQEGMGDPLLHIEYHRKRGEISEKKGQEDAHPISTMGSEGSPEDM